MQTGTYVIGGEKETVTFKFDTFNGALYRMARKRPNAPLEPVLWFHSRLVGNFGLHSALLDYLAYEDGEGDENMVASDLSVKALLAKYEPQALQV